jgi:uncharacterized membrane protein SirB2
MADPAEDMDYLIVKTVHQSAVALSFAGFFARGLGALADAPWVGARAAKTLPHIVDSVLLLSALWLAWTLRLNPAEAPWLLAKIIGLLAYIGLGMLALKPGRPLAQRAFAWLAALAVFGYIVSVALTKNPLGFIALK